MLKYKGLLRFKNNPNLHLKFDHNKATDLVDVPITMDDIGGAREVSIHVARAVLQASVIPPAISTDEESYAVAEKLEQLGLEIRRAETFANDNATDCIASLMDLEEENKFSPTMYAKVHRVAKNFLFLKIAVEKKKCLELRKQALLNASKAYGEPQ
ncbi:unnamed protein product [Linum trigynum]